MSALSDDEIRALLPHLQRFALGLTRERMAAEDLVQNTLVKALDAARDETRSLRAWLFSILWHQFIDGERRRKRWQAIMTLFSRAEPFAESAEHHAIADEMLALFARLPADSRALLLLVNVEGMRYQEAADTLDIPLGTVMSRLSRARKQLQHMTEGLPAPVTLRRLK
ncbi:hypothetical protein N172_08220 [Pantoea dispersa EGD-AAK13]|uniref:RNA polymerase subunit sigma-24 n=1 Tax=Pantoea dispersa TaxID=59814 RepID=A0A8E1RWN8_9GAMM|nr:MULTISPECIES: sigma-70 family RNA polymerase sigma factor [Pantoea]ERH62825.1 hypothetical protein N172_08220 [Pantoea dispersa EGD-AAK13]KTR90001.1 RNA polymerase subunit sigma-24 [Pantoea dispersa]KTR98283.1 RNA polymerase subunit sigma-24 [Pantoea dispersa]KTS22857.1 RNA polymerase subunit sigma-24 [Pantoea dispersa]KTS57596.1 RNA polymerase subunit sigma-24 [Pantoea dispersa]